MHGREIIKKIGQYIDKHAAKLRVVFFCVLISAFFCSCQANQAVSTDDPDIISEDNLAALPTSDPTPSPTPTPKPSASISREDPLTDTDAQTLLNDRFGSHNYTLTLLTDHITIEGDSYFAYEVSNEAKALEPVVIVNKYTGRISCMNSDGKIIPFSAFPSSGNVSEAVCDWNGTFIRTGALGNETSRLTLIQNDDSSFTFILCTKDSITENKLYAIAYVNNNSASFIDESNHELFFIMENDSITVIDDGLFDQNGLTFDGTYQFANYDNDTSLNFTRDDAVLAVSQLTSPQTSLGKEIAEYKLTVCDKNVIVNDRICYCIEAYEAATPAASDPVLAAQFYVTADGNRIYEYTPGSDFCNSIITIY